MNDLKFAFRQLLKKPGFTTVAVLTLALGIGATTAIFSVVYGVLIRPYPYARPGEIWSPGLRSAKTTQVMRPYRLDEFQAIAALPVFSEVMGTDPEQVLLTGQFAPEEINGPQLTANAFQFLGVAPILGRTFGPADFHANGQAEPVTVLSCALWQRLFGGNPNAIGRTLRLDDRLYTVIGVMPPRFGWWTSDGLWLPMVKKSETAGRIFPIARLKPGVKPAVARQLLQSLQLRLAQQDPDGFPKERFESMLTNYLDMTVASGTMRHSLELLFGAVGFLLLIACANVANLQLARATARTREMAIRLAVGAGRGRVLRQLLTESVLLSVLGGAVGLLCGWAITRLMVALMPSFYVPNEARIVMNGYVLLFCFVISCLTGIVFGLAPAVQSLRADLTSTLKAEDRGASSARGGRLRAGLVVTEVALSVVLLVSAGLTLRSFLALEAVDWGIQPEHVMTLNFTLPSTHYRTLGQRNRFAQELLARVQQVPGVQAAEVGNGGLPFAGPRSAYAIGGQANSDAHPLRLTLASADYLKTLGLPLRRGRMFDEREVQRGDAVAVINEAAAKLWPAGEDPIGTSIQLDLLKHPPGSVFAPTNSSPAMTVIGICADTRNDGLTAHTQPAILIPYTRLAPPGRALAIRSHGGASALLAAVRAQARSMDPQLPMGNPQLLKETLANQTVQPRFMMALFSLFAVFALALASIGIYCVLSYLVTRRTRELGVRLALGAQRGEVLALILKDGGRLAGLGIVVGVLLSVGAARIVASQVDLFHVHAFDPVSVFGVVLLLSVVSVAACWLPAWRASRVDPMVALRNE